MAVIDHFETDNFPRNDYPDADWEPNSALLLGIILIGALCSPVAVITAILMGAGIGTMVLVYLLSGVFGIAFLAVLLGLRSLERLVVRCIRKISSRLIG